MISVVMPAHNEEAYLADAVATVVAGLARRGDAFEVVICENGSADATVAVARGLVDQHPEVHLIQLPAADYGKALRAGFLSATGDVVVNFDVDLTDLAFLDAAVAVADREPDVAIVVGSKRGPGSEDTRSVGRRAVTAIFTAVLHRGFGLKVSDTHGLKLLRRAPLAPLVAECRFGAEIFDTELILRAERAGLGVTELPVRVADQRPPRTSIVRRIPRTLVGLTHLRLLLWREGRRRVPGAG